MSDNSHVLYATLKGLKLEISETQIPEGNFNSVKLILSKSLEWKDLLLCLNVLYSDNQSAQFEIQKDEVELSNVFTRSGPIQLGIVGMKQEGDIVKASNLVALNVTEGGYIVNAGVDASDYTLADRVFRAVQEAKAAMNEASSYAGEAKNHVGEAKYYAGEAAGNADISKSHADEAAEYKNATEISAKNALEYASNSENSAKEAYSALEQVQAEKNQILSIVGDINEALFKIVSDQEVLISE